MTRNVIILVLAVSATAAGAWAKQVKDNIDPVKTFDVIASQFTFEPATISVAEGGHSPTSPPVCRPHARYWD